MLASMPRAPPAPCTRPCSCARVLPARPCARAVRALLLRPHAARTPCALRAARALGHLRLCAALAPLRPCAAPALLQRLDAVPAPLRVHADRLLLSRPRVPSCLPACLTPVPSAPSSPLTPRCAPMRLCAVRTLPCLHTARMLLRPHVAPAPVPRCLHALPLPCLGVSPRLSARSAPAPAVAPSSPAPCHAPFARLLLRCPRASCLVVDPHWHLAGHKRICAPRDQDLGWCPRRAPPISLQNIPLAVLA